MALQLDSESAPTRNCEFPVLLENAMLVGDMTVVQLKDKKQLEEEGDRMKIVLLVMLPMR